MIRIAIVGAIFGALSNLLSYGVGGGLVLSLTIGTIVILIREDCSRSKLTLIYSLSLMSSFCLIWSLHTPGTFSDLDGLLMLAGFVLAPYFLALFVEFLLWMRENIEPGKMIDFKSLLPWLITSLPRVAAAIAFLIGLVGAWVSRPLLLGFETSLWFVIGASSWAFFLWRANTAKFREEFYLGWIWSAILHLGMLPLSMFIPRSLDTQVPLPTLILVMFVLSVAGLASDLYRNALASREAADP